MEDLMTLEQFHQRVLFQLIDGIQNPTTKWISVDQDGMIYGFSEEPEITEDFDDSGNGEWVNFSEPDRHGNKHIKYIATGMYVNIPEHIDWRDCIWKL